MRNGKKKKIGFTLGRQTNKGLFEKMESDIKDGKREREKKVETKKCDM